MASVRVTSRRSQGRMRNRKKPSIVICPASVPVIVELCPAQSKAKAKAMGAICVPSVCSSRAWACWISVTGLVIGPERRRGHDQDRRVDEKRAVHGDGRIDQVVLAGVGHRLAAAGHVAALHQGRVQVQIVRHYRGADMPMAMYNSAPRRTSGHKTRGNSADRRLAQERFR